MTMLKHAFSYTAEEREHLALLQQWLFIDDGSWYDPAYWRHSAEVAREHGESEREFIEQAEALECGMTYGGETL